MSDMTDDEAAERATTIGSELCDHLEEQYPDELLVLGIGAMHASVVQLVMAGMSVDDVVALAEEHAKSFEARFTERYEGGEGGQLEG